MFGFIKKNKEENKEENKEKKSFISRLKDGISKTREQIVDLFAEKKAISPELMEELETRLLMADVGIEATEALLKPLSEKIEKKDIQDTDAVREALAAEMIKQIQPYQKDLDLDSAKPFVILMVGINGAGKTTTVGKLANKFKAEGKKVMLAAADTFRAAAVEQLQQWGEKNQVPVIAQKTGADAASVAYDALQSAIAKKIDVLLIDTAGRLHTQDHLMAELQKIKRVLQKINPDCPQEILLVIDAANGQNALKQAEQFNKAMGLGGLIITKLDGTAKGGILFAITQRLNLSIRFIGCGEGIEDLRAFNAEDFVNALLYSE